MSPHRESRTVSLADGAVVRVDLSGTGPALLLLHGFTGDASTLGGLASRLEDEHTVIVPDLMGHGATRADDPSLYSVEAMAAQARALMDALGHATFDLAGYSMGGRVALTLACLEPTRVRSLALIGASAGLPTDDERAARRTADEELAASIERDGLEAFVDNWMANPLFATQARLGEERLAEFRAQRLGNDAAELARSLRRAGTGSMLPLHDDLAGCAVPTRLLVGADDEKFTAIAHELAGRLPNAEVVIVEGAGHAAHLEQPDAVASAIREGTVAPLSSIHPIELPLARPITTARGALRLRVTLLFALTHESVTGWGEASPLPGWSIETVRACRRALLEVQPEIGSFVADGADWANVRRRLAPLERTAPAARAAIVGALVDLGARAADRLLSAHLRREFPGPTGRSSTPLTSLAVHALITDPDPDVVAAEVGAKAAEGYSTIKLKIGVVAADVDRARVAAARAAAPDVRLRLDGNGGFELDEAVAFLDSVRGLEIAFCEEPTAGIGAIAEVGRRSGVPVAVDESARTLDELDAVVDRADEIAAVIVKPQALGGPDLALDAIARVRGAGLEPVVTTMIDSGVGIAHAAHVAAAAGLDHAHGLATAGVLAADVAATDRALSIAGGRLRFAALDDADRWGPGLGIGPISPHSPRPS